MEYGRNSKMEGNDAERNYAGLCDSGRYACWSGKEGELLGACGLVERGFQDGVQPDWEVGLGFFTAVYFPNRA